MANPDQVDAVVDVIKHNSGGPQPETVRIETIATILIANASQMTLSQLKDALQEAVDDDLLEERDGRYPLTEENS